MGKIHQGILGGFNGKTGAVVGASWKGIAYMRGKAQSIKNPRTQMQQANRTLFGTISDIMSKARSVVDFGYMSSAVKKSAFNCAVQDNVKEFALSGGSVVLNKLVFSKGGVLPIVGGTSTKSGDVISVTGTLAEALVSAKTVYCLAVFDGTFVGAPFVTYSSKPLAVEADDFSISIATPSGVVFTTAYVFAFLFDPKSKDASVTTYLGSISGS